MDRDLKSVRTSIAQKLLTALCIIYLSLPIVCAAAPPFGETENKFASIAEPISATEITSYDWNLQQTQRPLLNLPDPVNTSFQFSQFRPLGLLRLDLSQSLEFDSRANKYLLRLAEDADRRKQSIEFIETGIPGRYVSPDNRYDNLIDNKGVKTIRSRQNVEYTFIRFSDGVDRCIRIKGEGGSVITLVYSRDNLIHSILDSSGRILTFNYVDGKIDSITQSWIADAVALNRTWTVEKARSDVKLAHASRPRTIIVAANASITARHMKVLPDNAVTTEYTASMISSDRKLAAIFGGPGAVAAANGFEPEKLAGQYPLYRGDITAIDGHLLRGHLSFAMHLYGNEEGTAESALYVPAGFTSHSSAPGPTDAAVTFFYPRLGNLTNVTLAVFHVANFAIESGASHHLSQTRIRIGNIGGTGGSCAVYKHSHIEFYRGNVGLPSAPDRERLRIHPVSVF